ncbi:MAG: hypothetical protein AAGG51_25010 [Cyanobacteria bacterium P01_G01_bin.54]
MSRPSYGDIFRTLTRPDLLKVEDCIKVNSQITLTLLFMFAVGSLVSLLFDRAPSEPEAQATLHPWILIAFIAILLIFVGGCLLAKLSSNLDSGLIRLILVLQGTVIVLFVYTYISGMWNAGMQIASGELKGGMSHPPGLLTFALPYGIKQILDFSGLSQRVQSFPIKRVPVVFFGVGLFCDVSVLFAMFFAFFNAPL